MEQVRQKNLLLKRKAKYIIKAIFLWYRHDARDLPWRHTHDPYKILISEVMLQQTQVDRVIPKYRQFLEQFSSIKKLAEAKTSAVITAWAGLGYNRRALFLQRTAQAVVQNHIGKFPQDILSLKKLPGVGDYTARAIQSFAFQVPVPMMDTNHRRFYRRVFFGMKDKNDAELLHVAEQIIPKHSAYDWNQALMDFGSLICTTRRPKCDICPIQKFCQAYPVIMKTKKHKNIKTPARMDTKAHIKNRIIPFIETDRYFRGRLVDWLREGASITVQKFATKYPELSKERLLKIVQQLEKDGLIVIRGSDIVFPDR